MNSLPLAVLLALPALYGVEWIGSHPWASLLIAICIPPSLWLLWFIDEAAKPK